MDLFYRVIADVVAPSANPPKPLYADLLTRLTYAQVPFGKLSKDFQAAVKYLIHRDVRLGFWGCFSGTDFSHLESHLGQEGEFVLLKQRLAGVEEDGMGDALGQGGDAPRDVLHLVSLFDGSVEQHVESLGNSRHH